MVLISVVIPSFRPESPTIETFMKIIVPEGYEVEYIFIVDNPKASLDYLNELSSRYKGHRIKIIQNGENLGASHSRNIGINNSKGKYVFFLDDDCKVDEEILGNYVEALEKFPNHPGYIGFTKSPKPQTSFHFAVGLSDMQHFWKIAELKKEFYWGITANLFIKREAIGDIRFPLKYPKKGGGEDIYFCLKVIENYEKNKKRDLIQNSKEENINSKLFRCIPNATITHPFWKEDLKNYLRFFRWGYGDVNLHRDFPKYCFRQYPNLIEFVFLIFFSWFISLPLTFLNIIKWNWQHLLLLDAIIIIICSIWELNCERVKFKSQSREYEGLSLLKAVFIRQLNDWGRFFHQFPRIWNISKRWDYFCSKESIPYERKNASIKFFGFCLIFFVIYLISYTSFGAIN